MTPAGYIPAMVAVVDGIELCQHGVVIERVDNSQFMYLVQEHPTFALMVMSVMAERLRHNPVAFPRD